jgi:hypothetical protein
LLRIFLIKWIYIPPYSITYTYIIQGGDKNLKGKIVRNIFMYMF